MLFRSDVPDLLAAMDVFAFSSASEGQPNVILEAMAAGLPVVAIGIPGLDEIVIGGETGVLTEDSVEAFAAGMTELLGDPARAARMGHAGQARVASVFSPAHMVRAFEATYERALAAHAA